MAEYHVTTGLTPATPFAVSVVVALEQIGVAVAVAEVIAGAVAHVAAVPFKTNVFNFSVLVLAPAIVTIIFTESSALPIYDDPAEMSIEKLPSPLDPVFTSDNADPTLVQAPLLTPEFLNCI